MMKDMKNPARILIGTVCCLSLFSAQAAFCAPDTPLDTVAAIDLQVQEAVSKVREEEEAQRQQMHQFHEMMGAQQEALSGQADGQTLDVPFPDIPKPADDSEESGASDGGETETEAPEEVSPETAPAPLEETETEFQPVKMGASLPNVSEEADQPPEEAETENPKTDDSVMVSRHGAFDIPKVDGLNEARINLYDYRMLREYPLSRLPKDLHILWRQLKEQVSSYDGTWSVFVRNMNTGQALVVNDSPMRSASVMKLFIMEAVYEAFDRGDIPRNEETVTLLRNMIINSYNGASNTLLSLLGNGDIAAGIEQVNEFIRLRGFSEGTVCYNGFEDPAAAIHPDSPNVIMAKDVGLLLSRVYNRAFLSRRVCNEIEQMMLEQATRYKIPRGLPEWVECGNKSGETDTIANDAAVIYGPTTDYILVVLSNDWSDENTANEQISALSSLVYRFFESS